MSEREPFGTPRPMDGTASSPEERDDKTRNELLQDLPEQLRTALSSSSRRVEFEEGQTLARPGKPLENVYFVSSGLVSIVGGEEGESQVEVAPVGREGLVGISAILGHSSANRSAVAISHCVAQAVDRTMMGTLLDEHAELRKTLLAYASRRMEQIVQLSVCNARHRLEQRLARWTLSAHARLGGESIMVTHRDLAQLLGVRRASVTEAMHMLEGHGAIRSHRGRLAIRDLDRLVELSCGCHRVAEPATA